MCWPPKHTRLVLCGHAHPYAKKYSRLNQRRPMSRKSSAKVVTASATLSGLSSARAPASCAPQHGSATDTPYTLTPGHEQEVQRARARRLRAPATHQRPRDSGHCLPAW